MNTIVGLYSMKNGEIDRFLNSFFNNDFKSESPLKWEKNFDNPTEATDIIGAFIDNRDDFDANMWISFDPEVFINITNHNVNDIIKYMFERFPY